MVVKTFDFVDYNGNKRTEEHRFNLSDSEIMEMELGITGGFSEYVKRIIAAQDSAELIKLFKEIILKSYGVKSADGRRFEKSEQLSREFSQTEAYNQLFMELATNADKASEFINGIVSADTAARAANNVVSIPGLTPSAN